jgi:hypothetical protein
MRAGGKRRGAGRPKGSRALTLLAPTGERMAFYEAARLYDKEALRVIASVMMDAKQPASIRQTPVPLCAQPFLDHPFNFLGTLGYCTDRGVDRPKRCHHTSLAGRLLRAPRRS